MTAPQLSPQWHEERKKRVTASMAGAILGMSPWMSRAAAMRSMVRDAMGAPREFTGNVATEYGNQNEAGAVFEYEMETMRDTIVSGFIPYEDWAGCSPDRLLGDDGGLEVKCPYGLRNQPQPIFKTLADQEHYLAQVQFSMFVTGRKWWDFYQWTAHGARLETALWDQDWMDRNIPILRQFHAEFLDELSDPARLEDHLMPLRVEMDTLEAHALMREYDELVEALERADERKKDLLALIVSSCGEKNGLFAGRKVTKVERAGAVSYAKAFKALMPNANLEPYRGKPSSYWTVS